MTKRTRKRAEKGRSGEKRRCKTPTAEEQPQAKNECESKAEDWCFICKDGGTLLLCDVEQCGKAYHSHCLKKMKLPVEGNKSPWHCSWHTCSKCHDPSTFSCYCCPTAVCCDCVDAIHFFPIRKEHGFCSACRKLVLFLENEMVKVKDLEISDRLFKEYYEIVKKDECLDVKDLPSPEERSEIKQKHKSSSNPNNDCDSIEGGEMDVKMIKLKRFKEQRKRKLNCTEKSENEAVVYEAPDVLFASIVSDNIKLVYLTRSLLQKLLKQPASFENKVKGSYVRLKSAPSDGRRGNAYPLMQVTGVKKASSGGDTDIKLQLLDIPNGFSIECLSDAYFSEEECEELRLKMKVGVLRKPTVVSSLSFTKGTSCIKGADISLINQKPKGLQNKMDGPPPHLKSKIVRDLGSAKPKLYKDELEQKARNLHRDITFDRNDRYKRALQDGIDHANEKQWTYRFFELWGRREQLETASELSESLGTPPKVIAEVPEPISDAHLNDRKENEVVPTSSPIHNELRVVSKVLEMDEKKQSENLLKSVAINNIKRRNRSTNAIQYVRFSKDALGMKSISKYTGQQKQTEGSTKFIAVDNECNGKKTASEQPTSNPGKDLTSAASLGDAVDLDVLLDQLVKPDKSCSSADGSSFEVGKHLEEALILSWKSVPISDLKHMVATANGVFTCFNKFSLSYSPFYELVKNYIRCCALLASTEQFKQGSSLEELAARYDSGKKYYEMISEGFAELSTYSREQNRIMMEKISAKENLYVKFETEHSVDGTEHQSRTLREVSMKVNMSGDEMRHDLEPPVKSKRRCHFEEVWEAFVNAKAALGL